MEGWHQKLNRLFVAPKPNVYVFVDILRDLQEETERDLRLLRLGAPPPAKKRKYRQVEDRYTRLRHRLSTGHITTLEFADAVGYLLSPSESVEDARDPNERL